MNGDRALPLIVTEFPLVPPNESLCQRCQHADAVPVKPACQIDRDPFGGGSPVPKWQLEIISCEQTFNVEIIASS